MSKLSTNVLSAQQLAPYVGCPCYINNSKEVIMGRLNFMMLHEYDKDRIRMIVPVLKRLSAITGEQGQMISRQKYYVDGFATNFVKKVADSSLFNFHVFVAEWGGSDCYSDLMSMGLDPFGFIDKGFAIDADAIELQEKYSIGEFHEIFF